MTSAYISIRTIADDLRLPGGWAIPIGLVFLRIARISLSDLLGVLFVISFPPLFGHEVRSIIHLPLKSSTDAVEQIVAILVGAVWGLWIGFGITAAGTSIHTAHSQH